MYLGGTTTYQNAEWKHVKVSLIYLLPVLTPWSSYSRRRWTTGSIVKHVAYLFAISCSQQLPIVPTWAFICFYYRAWWLPSFNWYHTAGSPGLVVMVNDSCSRGRGFESQHRILDGHDIFSHWFVVKIVLFVWKRPRINKKRPGLAHFLKIIF